MLKSIQHPVVLIGGKEDEMAGQKLKSELPDLINLCARLNIDQSALVMKGSAKVISHVRGMMNISAALQKLVISIWGNTVPEFGMYPYYGDLEIEEVRLEMNDLSCRPCSKLGFDQCPRKHFKCMELQSFEGIS